MLYFKALHIIAVVAWFAGLFYLPRLFVYHSECTDKLSIERFQIMEKRLYFGITWPAALMTTIFGLSLFTYNFDYYSQAGWMHAKLGLVLLLWAYHLSCGYFVQQFRHNKNSHSSKFYRIFNEIPTILLVGIVFLVVLK